MELEGLLKKAENLADEAEIYYSSGWELLARNSLNKIETCKSLESEGVGVRLVKKGATGFSYFSDFSQAETALRHAGRAARLTHAEKYSLPMVDKAKQRKVKVFDKKLAALNEHQLIELILESISGIRRFASPSQGEVSVASSNVRILNSHGIDLQEWSTFFSVMVAARRREAIGQEYWMGRKLDCDVRAIGKKAGRFAAASVGGKPLKFSGTVILDPDVMLNLFSAVILRAVNGEIVRRKKSVWADKLEQAVMDSGITLLDDPCRHWGVGSAAFDDEGIATKKKAIVESGVLKSFLYDSRTANLAGTASTGNGFRHGFTSRPGISVTNLVLQPRARQNVFDVDKAVFVRELMGYHNVNTVTGDFALNIEQGFLVEHGELGKPVRGCMLTGNFFDLLKQEPAFHTLDEDRSYFHGPAMAFEGRIVG